MSNQYQCSKGSSNQWCIDEIFRCDGYHSCPEGTDELECPSMKERSTDFS